MKMRLAVFSLAALGLLSIPAFAASPEGNWSLGGGDVTVNLAQCGGSLCAKVAGLAKPARNGKPKVDRHNKIKSLQDRPLMGLQLAKLKPAGSDKWEGVIYNPDDGNSYSATVTMTGPNSMTMRGCVLGILCKSSKMTRR